MTNAFARDIEKYVDGLIHLDTQDAETGVDLTVAAIYRIDSGGDLDFGGSEFRPARRSKLRPELADEEDDYGWWELDSGVYVLRYNESLKLDGHTAIVSPLPRLVATGASHPAMTRNSTDGDRPLEVVLRVPNTGVRIKENARVSRLVVHP